MRTIQVINVRWFNATAYYALNLAKLLNEAGHPSLVLCLDQTECFYKAQEMGLDTVCIDLNTKNIIAQIQLESQIAKIIGEFKPDLINCHRGESFIHFAKLKDKYHYKLVRTRGDQRLAKNNFVNRYLYQKKADAIICTNSKIAKHIINILQVPKEKVHIILGGVDTKKFTFSDEARDRLRIKHNYIKTDFVLGLVGRFDYVKGQKELINLVGAIREQCNGNLRLLLVGFPSATSQKEIQAWIDEAKIQDIVQITGKVDHVEDYYSCIDLVINSSLYSEAIARVALEVMSLDRPFISSDIGVMPDLLGNEALFTPGHFELLGEKIVNAYVDCLYIHNIIINQKLSLKELDFSHFLSQTLTLYQNLMEI